MGYCFCLINLSYTEGDLKFIHGLLDFEEPDPIDPFD